MKKVMLVFLLIFSLLIMKDSTTNCSLKDDSFKNIEKLIYNSETFIENGIKMEYYTYSSENDEKNRISRIFDQVNICNNNNIFELNVAGMNYRISFFNYDDNTKVDIEIINKDKTIDIEELIEIAEGIRSKNYISSRVSKYIKQNNIESIDNIKKAENELKKNTIRSLEINNGIVCNAIMKDNNKLNIAQVNYDTGSYFIIGTPTIFITY